MGKHNYATGGIGNRGTYYFAVKGTGNVGTHFGVNGGTDSNYTAAEIVR